MSFFGQNPAVVRLTGAVFPMKTKKLRYQTMRFKKIPKWCAGVKVSGLYDLTVINNFKLETIFKEFKKKKRTESVIVISSNSSEERLNQWLKKNGFKKAEGYKNYNHNERNTYLWTIQVPKAYWTSPWW